jgi:hypothetical protein
VLHILTMMLFTLALDNGRLDLAVVHRNRAVLASIGGSVSAARPPDSTDP